MRKEGMSQEYLVAGIIIVAIIVILGIVLLTSFPDLKEKLFEFSDEVLGIKKEVFGQAKVETNKKQLDAFIGNFTQELDTCYKSVESGCLCGVNLPKLPEDYKLQILSGGSSIKLRVIEPSGKLSTTISTKSISGINLGVLELGYNKRNSIVSWLNGKDEKKEFIDIVCKFDKQLSIIGGEDTLLFDTPVTQYSGIIFESKKYDKAISGMPLLYKYTDGSFCLVTERMYKEYYKGKFGKAKGFNVFDSKANYVITDFIGERKLNDMYKVFLRPYPRVMNEIQIAKYRFENKPRCDNINYHEYIWPIEKKLTGLECIYDKSLATNSKYPYYTSFELTAPKGTYIRSSTDGTVAKICDRDCKNGNKSLVIKYIDNKVKTEFDIIYENLARIDDKFKKVGTKVKRGEAIAYVGSSGDGAKLQFSIQMPRKYVYGEVIDPGCRLPQLTKLYASSNTCSKYTLENLQKCN